MFDPTTAQFLRSAPALPNLDPNELPQLLTMHYAELVARRLRRVDGESAEFAQTETDWPLSRIADSYELIVSVQSEPESRRAAAFVAGTAQQILAKDVAENGMSAPIMDRYQIDPSVSAALLFLAAEQYADAHEAARNIRIEGRSQDYVCTILAEHVRDLASGRFESIIHRADRRQESFDLSRGLEERSTVVLFETLNTGVELFAAEILGLQRQAKAIRFEGARSSFEEVLTLSSMSHDKWTSETPEFITSYPGPRHLSSLLLSAYDGTVAAAVTKLPPPNGADENFWRNWLRHRANGAPFLWPNHRLALAKGFHETGRSAVLVLPTGAGKTTVSCIKIAGVLARGKSVIFIAPTHALVDQLTEDLQLAFPETLNGSMVSSDFDRNFSLGSALGNIEIMTPERCLALLSYAPEVFEDVGLLVFDECHLLSPASNLRRALDSMFCVLAFNSIAPSADFLFLSAMLKNGEEFAAWIQHLTGRECIFADPLWKPSRQARGVVLYDAKSLKEIKKNAREIQISEDVRKGKKAVNIRTAAERALVCEPYALFGLQHNWLGSASAICTTVKISDSPVALSGKLTARGINLKPNVNVVAGHIAAAGARNGLKGIIFVSSKVSTASTARDISNLLGQAPKATPEELIRWDALKCELGDLKHSLLPEPAAAVPHNAQMIRLERELAERLYRRADGAQVIVATPTLAQGLNLPAHIAILAGDKRSDPEDGEREALEAHEILNAAARAGRAGHLANGVVLLVPEAVLQFKQTTRIESDVVKKLQSVLPEDDRCLTLGDPLEVILDRISTAELLDGDVEYTLNRLATAVSLSDGEVTAKARFVVQKSFAAFLAEKNGNINEFNAKIGCLNVILSERNVGEDEKLIGELATQSGAPIAVLKSLRQRLLDDIGQLPQTIHGWVSWIVSWLVDDASARNSILGRDRRAILGSSGFKKDGLLTPAAVQGLETGVHAWIAGAPFCEIEKKLGGDPDKKLICPQARDLISHVIPLSFSFASGLLARTAISTIEEVANGAATSIAVVECLAIGVRRGFDTPNKIAYADIKRGFSSRVQTHLAFDREVKCPPAFENSEGYQRVVDQMRTYIAFGMV